ncbi:helix-turn-helix transcriptional regulator [Luteimicrobium xylanilyticum]|uniref:HTH cro/C1-type domain-containing protein n=1 Tax=Luteimicrobium xylanilyticum TaxID=1133546 RepID=A0A5P9QGM9_9MICO|nr:helix-turn-helix transcriptional regulator [Luteimicrobium xylanilyticum]QFU99605.1 hypothetical protein KDY119_03140 [Luteimicrobium xylanilyticum]
MSPGPSAAHRRELADFLRTRRARVTPELVGLPHGGRRRTPGLRREEVAQLSGIGVTWYTWLEQGRDIHVSDQVLEAVARTLRLDRSERTHLFTLAGAAAPSSDRDHVLDEATLRVVDAVLPFPACIQNARYDLLAYNRAYARLIGDLDAVPVSDRNTLWLTFTDPAWHVGLVDWEDAARRMVAQLRAHLADHAGDTSWTGFVRRLRAASDKFSALWDEHDVTDATTDRKPILNPAVGLLEFELSTTWLAPGPGARLVVFTPADQDSAVRLDRLLQEVSVSADGAASAGTGVSPVPAVR